MQLSYHQKKFSSLNGQKEKKAHLVSATTSLLSSIKGKRGIKSWILTIKLLYQALKLLLS